MSELGTLGGLVLRNDMSERILLLCPDSKLQIRVPVLEEKKMDAPHSNYILCIFYGDDQS